MNDELLKKAMQLYDEKKYVEAGPLLIQCADTDDPVALFRIGNVYLHGCGVEMDEEQALFFYKKSAKKGYILAQYNLGKYYLTSEGERKSYEQSFYWFYKAADQGDVISQFSVGLFYFNGQGVEQSCEEAFNWFEKAANQGYYKAQASLADCYYYGEGVKQSYVKAVHWYRMAANQEDPYSQYMLGTCYSDGFGVTQSLEEAARWYKKAAKNGYADAQYNLATCFERGNGVPQSYEQAIHWYKIAADQGCSDAQYNLGVLYYEGKGVDQSYEQAFEWFEKAANNGCSDAQNNLGNCYFEGCGVPQSYEQAVHWYKEAAKQENRDAQSSLGDCYYFGLGVPQSYKDAFDWYKLAAEQGDVEAMFSLGYCYFEGCGVPQSYEQAVHWFKLAAEQGDAEAKCNLGYCYFNGYGVEQSYEHAIQWYEQAAEQGDAEAKCNLGFCYFNGYGVEQSFDKAIELYSQAIEDGFDEAKKDLAEIIAAKEKAFVKNESIQVSPDVDVFFSWNHYNEEMMEDLTTKLQNSGISVWQSNKDAEGELDNNVKYAINKTKTFIVILSPKALTSKYMPLEIDLMFERLEKEKLPKTLITIYVEDPKFQYADAICELEENNGFRKLLGLSARFTEVRDNIDRLIDVVKQKRTEFLYLNYQRQLKDNFALIPFSLTNVFDNNVTANGIIKSNINFDESYVMRTLMDENQSDADVSVLLNSQVSLIYGDGGTGKSTYVKWLIRTYSNDEKIFYFLPCSDLKDIDFDEEELSIISIIKKKIFTNIGYESVDEEDIFNAFNNKTRHFYIVIDALDEIYYAKEKIIRLAKYLLTKYFNIHIVFTSRNAVDQLIIEKEFGVKINAFTLRKMNDDELFYIFMALYNANNSENDKDEGVIGINPESFKDHLGNLDQEIKDNPLLMANLIFIFFATQQIQSQKSFILEKTTNIIVKDLEDEKKLLINHGILFNDIKASVADLLDYISYNLSLLEGCQSSVNVGDIIYDYLLRLKEANKDNEQAFDNIDLIERSERILMHLRNRRLVIGNDIAHHIFRDYYAARYIYNLIYKLSDEPLLKKQLVFKDKDAFFSDENREIFTREDSFFPTITSDFIFKFDYEINALPLAKTKINNVESMTRQVIDETYNELFKEGGISDTSYQTIKKLVGRNALYYSEIIKLFMKRK